MTNWIKGLKNILLKDEMSIQQKVLNLILSLTMVGGISSLVVDVLIQPNWITKLAMGFVVIFGGIALYLSVVKNKPTVAAMLDIILINMVVFPVLYFHAGGMNSGMPVWFVLELMMAFLVIKGKKSYIIYGINITILILILSISYKYPQTVTPLSDSVRVWDVIHSVIVVSCIFGAIFKLQTYIYENQQKHLMEQEEKLRQTMEELKKANKAKSDFLANMSHEIRTPINAMLGMNEMILRENEQNNITTYAMNVQTAGQGLLALVNDILDFSKIESGKMEILPTEYDVAYLLKDCFNMVYMWAAEKNIQFRIKNNPDIPAGLYGDEVRIHQVISNLLTNAVKYTKEGFVELEIDWKPIANDDIWLIICVKDSGMGISRENQEKLFDFFQRIDEKKNRNIEGYGLGLTIAKQFVDLMKGSITVKSELGKGTTFSVMIPQKVTSREPVGDFSDKAEQMMYSGEKYQERFHAPDARLLIVDDVKMNLDVIKGLLKNTKIQMDFAYSGEEALKLVKEKEYHLIFMDDMMPDMDGIQTLHRMKEMVHRNKTTPVIALTANAILGADEEYLQEGFADYLSKPVHVKSLENVLLRFLPKELVLEVPLSEKKENIEKTLESEEQQAWISQIKFLETQTGLHYCAESATFYKDMLKLYVDNDKREGLEQFYQTQDWENYRILVHALKSTSLSIGAVALSEKALALENAAKEKRTDYINEHHAAMMKEYERIQDSLSEVL